jgi:hypothetical protein
MNKQANKFITVPANPDLDWAIHASLDLRDYLTEGIRENVEEYKQGEQARNDNQALDQGQSEFWIAGWTVADREISGSGAFLAGRPFDKAQTIPWILGYLAQKNLEDSLSTS